MKKFWKTTAFCADMVEEHMRVPWPFSLTKFWRLFLNNLKVLI